MSHIKYVGYYDLDTNDQNRYYVLSSVNKMTYICSALNRTGWHVEIVSASGTQNRKGCPGERLAVSDQTELVLFPSIGTGRKPKRILKVIYGHLCLASYLLSSVRRGDPVLVYHSLGYVRLIRVLKKLIGFRLILEVEEIYADVTGDERARKREMHLFEAADAYLFPTELLDEKINTKKKPSAIIYGTYQVEEDRKCRFEDGKVHLLYAGTFDPRKGGATAAAAAGELPENYHVHILGFGSDGEVQQIKEEIEQVNQSARATVTYDGLLSGEEYIRFVQSCDVGFSTQMPDAAFNDTSFPSKVLSYLANGLRVVSVRIKALEQSAIGDLLCYYDKNTPKAIADAVKKIDFSQYYDSRAVIRKLDEKFVKEIGELLSDEH